MVMGITYLGPLEEEKQTQGSEPKYLGPLENVAPGPHTNEPLEPANSIDAVPDWVKVGGPSAMALWGAKNIISNVPSSAMKTLGDIVGTLTHPIEAGKGLYNLATFDKNTWSALGTLLKDRYGSMEAFNKTLTEDPVGFASDLTSVLQPAGGLMSKAGQLGNLGKLAEAGKTVSSVGKAVDPFNALYQGTVKPASRVVGGVGSQVLGVTTGAGSKAIKEAYRGGKEFTKGLRGKISEEDILYGARESLGKVDEAKKTAYRNELQNIKGSSEIIDQNVIIDKIDKLTQDYNIQIGADKKGRILVDFGKSPINRKAQNAIRNTIKDTLEWQDWTPMGVDTLYRKVGDMFLPSKEGNAFVQSLKSTIKKEIVDKVPEYAEMKKKYAITSQEMDKITRALALGEKTPETTFMNRIGTVFRDPNEYKLSRLQKLDELGGSDLLKQAAGASLHDWTPRGFMPKVGAGFGVGALMSGSPVGIPVLAASSPRIVGETVRALGKTGEQVNKFGPYVVQPNVWYQLSKLLTEQE
jgi:hypothetical protein